MKFLKKFLFTLFIFFLILPNISQAQQMAEMFLSANLSEVEVGGELQISLSIKNISTDGFNLGSINIPGLENFQERGTSQSTQVQIVNGGSMAVTDLIKTVVAPRAGKYQIGPVSMGVKDDKGQVTTVTSEVVEINVVESGKNTGSTIDDSGDLPREEGKVKSFDYMKMLINILALAFLAALIYFLRKKSEAKDEVLENEVEVKIDNSFPSDDDADFYIKVKRIALNFIKNKFKIEVESKTSQEILLELKNSKSYLYDDLKKVLETCDYGKFSGRESDKSEIKEILRKLI